MATLFWYSINPVSPRSAVTTLSFLLVFGLAFAAVGQPMLAFKKSKSKIAYYESGEVISFRLKGDRTRHTFQIEGFTDSTIVFRYHQIALREISHVYVDQKTRQWFAMRYKYEKLLLIAGFGYFMMDVINTGELSDETKWVSLSLIGAGIVAKFMVSDKFRIGGKKRLYLLDTSPPIL
jgi:hypothetical protein